MMAAYPLFTYYGAKGVRPSLFILHPCHRGNAVPSDRRPTGDRLTIAAYHPTNTREALTSTLLMAPTAHRAAVIGRRSPPSREPIDATSVFFYLVHVPVGVLDADERPR